MAYCREAERLVETTRPPANAALAKLVRQYRREREMTQEQLAERASVSVRSIQDLERGITLPRKDTLERLVTALGLAGDACSALEIASQGARNTYAHGKDVVGIRPNLPTWLTSFVGREQQTAQLRRVFESTRLLTLTGMGGIGKTRLALQLAATLDRPDEVWFVELAALADPSLVPLAMARVVGVPEQPGSPIASTLVNALRQKQMVVVLDNCEHLVQACAEFVHLLLTGCPELRVLATSRERLHVPGEQVWPVPPLSVTATVTVSRPASFPPEAVQLFLDRARAVQPAFAPSEENLSVIADICRRLDGIPLAIELAAARLEILNITQIAEHIDERFRLLTDGYRTAPARQRTLRATVEWSFNLLSEAEQRMFARLSVFTGGWTLEAAQAVCTAEDLAVSEVLDLLGHLATKSLVLPPSGGQDARCYALLETVRAFAREQLEASNDLYTIRARHAEYFLRLATEVGTRAAFGEHRSRELDRLKVDLDNFRDALNWTIESGADEESLLRWAPLATFWMLRGHYAELHAWLALFPPQARPTATQQWARGVSLVRALLAFDEGHLGEARRNLEEALAIARRVGDQPTINRSLANLGRHMYEVGDYAGAAEVLPEALRSCQVAGDRPREAIVLRFCGTLAYAQGEYAAALAYCDASLAIHTELDNAWGSAATLCVRADLARAQGDATTAVGQYETALALVHESNNHQFEAHVCVGLGRAAQDAGDLELAQRMLLEGMRLSVELGLWPEQLRAVEGLAGLAAAVGDATLGLRLAGAAATYREHAGTPLFPTDQRLLRRALEPAMRASGAAASVELVRGREISLESAMALARAASWLSGRPRSAPVGHGTRVVAQTRPGDPDGYGRRLTVREHEVARLVAQGLSNRRIAAELVVTEATAAKHVEHILEKLGFSSRVEIATWAAPPQPGQAKTFAPEDAGLR